jgi:hypothetical protein
MIFFFIFLLKLKILEAKVKFWCGTHITRWQFKNKIHSGKSGVSESKELKLRLVWPKHTNILFIFSVLFFRYSNMILFFLAKLKIKVKHTELWYKVVLNTLSQTYIELLILMIMNSSSILKLFSIKMPKIQKILVYRWNIEICLC